MNVESDNEHRIGLANESVGGRDAGSASRVEPASALGQRTMAPPPDAAVVILVRHGQTIPAVPGVSFPLVNGQGDPPLTDLGHAQAARVAERVEGSDIASVYVSTMVRTLQTAQPLLDRTGHVAQIDADLREIHLGEWEGGRFRFEASSGNPIFADIYRTGRYDHIPGSEPHDQFVQRLRGAFDRVVGANIGRRALVVAHGGVIGALLASLLDVSPRTFFAPDNGSISVVYAAPSGVTLRSFNETSHLAGVESR